jgi:predicted HTH transcriptional regulator
MASKVESLIQEFVVSLRAAIAEEAAQAFLIAGGGTVSTTGRSSAGSQLPRAKAAKRAAPKGKGGKRTAEEMAAQSDAILSYLKKNPAQGAEQLGAALGVSTAELALPIKQLIAKKALKFVGQKRGRKYSAR